MNEKKVMACVLSEMEVEGGTGWGIKKGIGGAEHVGMDT